MIQTRQDKPRRRRWLYWSVGLFLLLLLLLVILAWGTPRRYRVAPIPAPAEVQLIYQVLEKASQATVDADGNLAECMVFSLNADEINALLHAMLRMAQRQQQQDDPSYAAQWEHGALCLRFSIPAGPGALNLEARMVPRIAGEQAAVTLDSVWLGSLPIPAFVVQRIVDDQLARFNADAQVRNALGIFESLSVLPDGSLEIRVLSANLSRFVGFLLAGEIRD